MLYRRTPTGREPVVDFTRRGDEWVIGVRDTPHRAAAEHALPRIGLYELQRAVSPDEGDLYLEALRQTFANSSRWGVAPVDDPAGE